MTTFFLTVFEKIPAHTWELLLYFPSFTHMTSATSCNRQTLISKIKKLKIHPIHLGTCLPVAAWPQIQLKIELQHCLPIMTPLLDVFGCSWMPLAVLCLDLLQLCLQHCCQHRSSLCHPWLSCDLYLSFCSGFGMLVLICFDSQQQYKKIAKMQTMTKQ